MSTNRRINICSLFLIISVLNIGTSVQTQAFKLTIFHTNDIHGRYEQVSSNGGPCTQELANNGMCFGGYARRVTEVQRIRDSTENVLLLDAGERFLGVPAWFETYNGLATACFMNEIGYNATVCSKISSIFIFRNINTLYHTWFEL